MRIVISENELEALDPGSVILPTIGLAWTKDQLGYWRKPGDLIGRDDEVLADGKPIIVLYDAGYPTRNIRDHVEDCAAKAIDYGNVELLPYVDFISCWNRHHLPEDRLELP